MGSSLPGRLLLVSGLMASAEYADADRDDRELAEAPTPVVEAPTHLQQAAAGMAEAQAWKGQQIAKGWRKLVNALRRPDDGRSSVS